MTDLRKTLRRIDGAGYRAYRDIEGEHSFDRYRLVVDHVQGDPFAAPSRVRILLDRSTAGFPADLYSGRSRGIALADYLGRAFHDAARRICRGNRGSGKGGLVTIDRPGQEILERTSVEVGRGGVEARISVGLPAFGRRVAGRHAEAMLFEELPEIVGSALVFESLDRGAVYGHVEAAEDADHLRDGLREMGLVAFVAEGSALPRASGIDQRPMAHDEVVRFSSPKSLRVEVDLPNRGRVTGLGIPAGVTLIAGGGYHGKSTLLEAIELGIYDHVPGDGRELVVTDPAAVKIKAEDGRRVERVDIGPFVSDLPFGRRTREFSTEDASGSTSQAANIVEAIQAGARVLLIDEDTSATNFMIRDRRMQDLVSKEHEPITPFVDKVAQLYRDLGISTVLVMGGSGDYLDVADLVLCMVEYEPRDETSRAREIARRHETTRAPEGGNSFGDPADRIPLADGFDARRGKRAVKIGTRGIGAIEFGRQTVDLGAIDQIVDESQTRAIGEALHYSVGYMDGRRTVGEVVDLVSRDVRESSLDVLSPFPRGDCAAFRGIELAAAMNRLRTLRVLPKP